MNPYVLAAIAVWDLIWKGIAMWKAARNSQKNWFIALLIFNTVGILSIAYIYFFQKKKILKEKKKEKKSSK